MTTEADYEAEMLRFGLKPLEPFHGVNAKWLATCEQCGCEVMPRLSTLRRGHSGCRSCASKKSERKFRIGLNEALGDMEAAKLTPLVPFPGLNAPWRSRCNVCDEIVTPRLLNIRNGHNGCIYCSGGRVSQQTALDRLKEVGLEPIAPYPGSVSAPWRTKCTLCQQPNRITLSQLKPGLHACKSCR